MATFDDFMKLDIRVGTITDAKVIANFMSEVLVLGTYSEDGVVNRNQVSY